MAEIKSESVADFIPESLADLLRNQQPGAFGIGPADHHELLTVQAFDCEPQTAIAGGIGRIGALGRLTQYEVDRIRL